MAGSGKRTALQEALRALAAARGLPFTLASRPLSTITAPTGDVAEAGATEEGAGPAEESQFQMETSLVHMGLDIARMSMQDKHILRPVLARLGQGSQVMAGDQGRGARILVLYHAHLLSSESVLLLQACLEQNEGDLSIWMTSEMPVPQRIRDWFVEIPVSGIDNTFEAYKGATGASAAANWPDVFRAMIDKWRASPPPRLQEIKEIKAFVYEMLMRNLRWVEAVHFLLDCVLDHPDLTVEERREALAALSACEATAGGYTIPSYRIPILWESLFLQLRSIFHAPAPAPAPAVAQAVSTQQADGGGTSTRARRAGRPRKQPLEQTNAIVEAVKADGS
jgi:hypothetical protein